MNMKDSKEISDKIKFLKSTLDEIMSISYTRSSEGNEDWAKVNSLANDALKVILTLKSSQVDI